MQPKNKTLATSQPKSSALPEEWVERLFARFEAMYGAKFADAWKGCDLRNVKVVWAEALGSLRRDEITAGIAGCMTREWPPTLPEFVKLCRQPDPNAPGGHPTANEAWATGSVVARRGANGGLDRADSRGRWEWFEADPRRWRRGGRADGVPRRLRADSCSERR
jgi:hypothetical protein